MDKKTLQKKIESGDTVWGITQYDELIKFDASYLHHPTWFETGEPILDKLNMAYTKEDGDIEVFEVEDDNVFATKEDAEFELEFGNITRTEKLELPNFDEIDTGNGDTVICLFNSKDGTEYTLAVDDFGDGDSYDWTISVSDHRKDFWEDFDFTYGGYLEACRLCKKLFLGEEL